MMENSEQRAEVLRVVADAVPRSVAGEPVLVAVDGVDGAGKSVFGDQFAEVLRDAGHSVIRASVDDFHRPREHRYCRGRESPSGFWLDSFDYDRLRAELLDPLSPGGSGRYRTAVHEFATDRHLDEPWQSATRGAVLVLDGLFLHRDELRAYWDLSVFLAVPFAVTARRMAERDGTPADPDHPKLRRYVGAQRMYFESSRPLERADVVIDNSHWAEPVIIRRPE
ncbi:uridine kinase [Kribbella amoyensis]|uniref:Uridine kinase n=1 Tax=Kribbella amoyensis TaxID=996641 RepID=A0A561BU38_9ACTN|nr:uridine kinase [Kribbella amoyensis]TWD82358.1 uridine kinase [Kribbella amoyensis]